MLWTGYEHVSALPQSKHFNVSEIKQVLVSVVLPEKALKFLRTPAGQHKFLVIFGWVSQLTQTSHWKVLF